MAKQLNKKSVVLGLAGLAVAGLAYAVTVKENEQTELDKYLGEYQEEAYPIGEQMEKEEK